MSIRKTYRSLVYKELDTYVLVDGIKRLIQFRGGSLQPRINGIYVTEDPKVIKAMDTDSGNGASFICIREEFVKEENTDKTDKAPDKNKKSEKALKEDLIVGPDKELNIEEVPGINNLQDARNYMLSRFDDLKPSQLNNTNMVKSQAAKKGIKFTEFA